MKKYSDSTLMRMTKAELIEQLRCAEHNREVAEEALAQQAENLKDWEPVIHCKDCEYGVKGTVNSNGFFVCDVSGLDITPNDFCSLGEKKEGDKGGS